MSLPLLAFTISEIKNFATNIKIIRIGTRVPVQDPSRVNENDRYLLKDMIPLDTK